MVGTRMLEIRWKLFNSRRNSSFVIVQVLAMALWVKSGPVRQSTNQFQDEVLLELLSQMTATDEKVKVSTKTEKGKRWKSSAIIKIGSSCKTNLDDSKWETRCVTWLYKMIKNPGHDLRFRGFMMHIKHLTWSGNRRRSRITVRCGAGLGVGDLLRLRPPLHPGRCTRNALSPTFAGSKTAYHPILLSLRSVMEKPTARTRKRKPT